MSEAVTEVVPAAVAPVAVAGERWPGLAGAPATRSTSGVSDAVMYTAGAYVAQGLTFLAGIVQKGLLGPTNTGYWSLVTTLGIVISLAPLGVYEGATRQVPQHRGRGDYAAAARLADTSISFTLVATTLASLLMALVALAFGASWPDPVRWGLVALGAVMPIRFFTDCHEALITATKRFDGVTVSIVVRAVMMLVLQSLFVVWLGYWGMFLGIAAMCIGALVTWTAMRIIGPGRPAFHVRVDRPALRELMSYGGPILVYSQVWLFFLFIDNLIVAGVLGAKQLGYYALAVSVTTYIMLLPKSVGSALFPRMAERYGRSGEVADIESFASDVQRILGYVLVPLMVAGAFFVFPVVVRVALPDFTPAIPVVHIVVAGSFFLSLTNMPIKMLMTAGYRWTLAGLMLACLAFNAAVNYTAVGILDEGLKGAAVATAISYFAFFAVVTVYALSRTQTMRHVGRHVAGIVGVFVYVTALMWGVDSVAGAGSGAVSDALIACAKFAVVAVGLTPFMVITERRYGALGMAKGFAGRLRRRGAQA